MTQQLDRRTFLACVAAASAAGLTAPAFAAADGNALYAGPRTKPAARVRGAFFYPPEQVVLEGRCEDGWAKYNWFTWPGNQFLPEQQQAKFMAKLGELTDGLDLDPVMDEAPIYTDAGIQAFIREIEADRPDALLLVNYWNSFSGKIVPILDAYDGPVILFHPLGSSHQLPPARFREGKRLHYIHAIEHWGALEDGLRAIHAMNRMHHSRLLRVSGNLQQEADAHEAFFDMPIHGVPAEHFNDLFDEIQVTPEIKRLARAVERGARNVTDLSEGAFLDGVRAHAAVLQLLERHEADAITIQCLMLKHRKPCLSFALNNGKLIPCGCENDLNASLTLMLGANLFGRGGFQHNPDFDTIENNYFASHCTCTTELRGPDTKSVPYDLRPFFHQLPKSLALDVHWPEHERATLIKYHTDKNLVDAWTGDTLGSPSCPPTGGCATRLVVKLDDLDNVCDAYPGPHPIIYLGDFGRRMKTLAKLYDLELRGNC